MIASIVIYSVIVLNLIVLASIISCKDTKGGEILALFAIVLPNLGFLGLIGVFASATHSLRVIDRAALNFMRDNRCSDGVLQHSIQVFADGFSKDMTNLGVAFGFAILAAVVNGCISYFFSPARRIIREWPKWRK